LHRLGQGGSQPLEWQQLRGVNEGVKTAHIPGIGQVAICNGISAAQRLLQTDAWRDEFVAIEVMACVGGCLGGGGEPKSMDPQILQKRMQAIYAIDQHAPHRRSDENEGVQQLYATELGQPNSPAAHALLHTAFAPRHSQRLLLMQLLDAVDRRDAKGVAQLFDTDGVWSTGSPLGEVQGRADIAALVETRLPPRQHGPAYQRHHMASAADVDDLTVITPHGERCTFSMETCTVQEDGRTVMQLRRLERRVLRPEQTQAESAI
jgi:Iron hydrogenase small subunit/SnoaL-like domain/Iron only hydrogenase large subunit, C-terminal domain